jgi:hypothetical protein
MAVLRTLDEIWAQGAVDGAGHPPLTQAQADLVAAILAPCRARMAAMETAPA